ncbi:MAG: magnesium transporter [bacterium]
MTKQRPEAPVTTRHPADLADEFQRLDAGDAAAALRALPRETASLVLAEMDEEFVATLSHALSTDELRDLLGTMPHDEAADIAAELPQAQRDQILARLEPGASSKLSQFLSYPEDSAGSIMTDQFHALPVDATIEACRELLAHKDESQFRGATYLYVVDTAGKLSGVITTRDLVFRKSDRIVRDVMKPDVKFVRVRDDQETVARLFAQYHYMALPVLEDDGRLVGVVNASQAIAVIQQEATEDMQRMVGVSGEERTFTPWNRAILRRLPWLMVNLATAFLAAMVVSLFEKTIAQWTALAVFLPIVAGQGGNAGMQTLTVVIRGMALDEISGSAGRKALVKEIIMGLLNGLATGLVVGLVGYLWKGSFALGVIVSLAMFLNMLAAAMSGVLIPTTLRAARIDPALASSIFLTTVTDVAGFFFFLGLATLALRM